MPVPSTMADLSLTAANNSPQGTDPIGNTLDDYLRSIQAILRSTNALAPASIASASTTNIGSAAAESVEITGTTTITSFGTAPAGIRRELRFTGSLTIVHSSSIQLPGAKNWQTAPGDVLTFRSLGSGQWIMTGHQSLDASRLTGTLDPARVPQGAVTQHQDALSISASQITSGTLADARLSSNIPRLNVANTFSAVQTVQVSSVTPLSIRRAGNSQNVNIEFRHDGATRYLGLDSSGNLRFGDTSNLSSSGVRVSLEGHTHDYLPLSGGTLTGNTEVAPGASVRFGHAQQSNNDDGKIGAGLFEPGLNIIGVQTVAGQGRRTRIWGHVYLHEGGRLYGEDGTAYLKSNYPSGNVTISTSGPSGGTDGDIWLQVL